MKIIKTAEGKTKLRITREDWEKIGNDNKWMKESGKDKPGERDGTGPYKGSLQRKQKGDVGKRKEKGEECPKDKKDKKNDKDKKGK